MSVKEEILTELNRILEAVDEDRYQADKEVSKGYDVGTRIKLEYEVGRVDGIKLAIEAVGFIDE